MTDHFAALGLPRSAWLDLEDIKSRHHALIAQSHPDKIHGDPARAAALNAARAILENPAARLRHLLELESPAHSAHSALSPHEPDWSLFSRLSEASRLSAEFQNSPPPATPLAHALRLNQANSLRAELASLADLLGEKTRTLEALTKNLPPANQDPASNAALAESWSFHQKSLASLKQSQEALDGLR